MDYEMNRSASLAKTRNLPGKKLIKDVGEREEEESENLRSPSLGGKDIVYTKRWFLRPKKKPCGKGRDKPKLKPNLFKKKTGLKTLKPPYGHIQNQDIKNNNYTLKTPYNGGHVTSSKWPPKLHMDIRKYLKPNVKYDPQVKPLLSDKRFNLLTNFSRENLGQKVSILTSDISKLNYKMDAPMDKLNDLERFEEDGLEKEFTDDGFETSPEKKEKEKTRPKEGEKEDGDVDSNVVGAAGNDEELPLDVQQELQENQLGRERKKRRFQGVMLVCP